LIEDCTATTRPRFTVPAPRFTALPSCTACHANHRGIADRTSGGGFGCGSSLLGAQCTLKRGTHPNEKGAAMQSLRGTSIIAALHELLALGLLFLTGEGLDYLGAMRAWSA